MKKVNPDVKYAIDRSQAEMHRGFLSWKTWMNKKLDEKGKKNEERSN